MTRVTREEIMEKYDLDKERRDIEVLLQKGELNLSFDEPMTKQELRDHIDSTISHYPENVLFKYASDEISVVERVMLPESNDEVIDRLLRVEKRDILKTNEN